VLAVKTAAERDAGVADRYFNSPERLHSQHCIDQLSGRADVGPGQKFLVQHGESTRTISFANPNDFVLGFFNIHLDSLSKPAHGQRS
jgi:hypothetical protein